jgi:hypothetical protein
MCVLSLVELDDDEDVVCIEAPVHPMLAHSGRLLAMAGPSESVIIAKVQSQHHLQFAQEIQ